MKKPAGAPRDILERTFEFAARSSSFAENWTSDPALAA
jgi:hypothetical protein